MTSSDKCPCGCHTIDGHIGGAPCRQCNGTGVIKGETKGIVCSVCNHDISEHGLGCPEPKQTKEAGTDFERGYKAGLQGAWLGLQPPVEQDTKEPDTLRGIVQEAGGGMVTILVDRDTVSYPEVGTRVTAALSPQEKPQEANTEPMPINTNIPKDVYSGDLGSEIETIITALRAGTDPDTKQLHITEEEAKAQIGELLQHAIIKELEWLAAGGQGWDKWNDPLEIIEKRIAALKQKETNNER